MENYFYINDVDSRSVGVFCGSFPAIVFPKMRKEEIVIEGRHGNLTETDYCYESYVFSLECYSEDLNIEQIEVFLRSAKTLRFSSDPNKVYKISITNQIDLSIVAEYWRNFIITFKVQPIIESHTEYEEIITGINKFFEVGGTFETKPIIELKGTGDFQLTINNYNIQISGLNNETIIIDTDLKIAVIENVNAMNKITGDLNKLRLLPGSNNIEIIGEYTSLVLKYKRSYLC